MEPVTAAMFPIMLGWRLDELINEVRASGQVAVIVSLPWAMLAPHEAQARRNHSQTLAGLAQRGGLSACEALAVLEGRAWHAMDRADANRQLAARLAAFLSPPEPK